MSRLLIVPDEKYEALSLDLKARLGAIAKELRWDHLADLIGTDGAFLLRPDAGDELIEIQIWGKSPTAFVVVWTSKGQRDVTIGTVTAELGRGLINQVFESERPEVKADDFLNASDWTNLETQRGAKLRSMSAHPITIFGRCVAVLSVSEFQTSRPATDAKQGNAKAAAAAALLLGRLMEDRLIRSSLGFNPR